MVVSSKFGSLVDFVSNPTPADNASLETYISTDNMLPDFGGITTATQLPKSGNVRQFQVGDTLFSNIRTYFRKVWGASFSGTCSPDVLLFRSKDSHVLNAKFLEYLCKWDVFTEHTVKTSRGAKMPRGDKAAIADFEIPLPDLQYQENVADLLSSLDDKIELNRQMNAVLEGMARAVFVDWFVDFGPTRRKMAGEADPVKILGGAISPPAQAQKTAALFPDRLGQNGLPEGWEETNISSLTTLLKRGLTPKYTEGGCLIVNQRCIRNGTISFSIAREHDETTRPLKNKQLQLGDVLVNSTGVGTLGRVATVRHLPSRASADTHVTIVRPNPEIIEPVIAALLLEGMADQIATMGHGSTGQTELKPSIIGEISAVLAPRHIQISFSKLVSPLRAKVDRNISENQTLAEMRDLLLPKLMSGEIRLREAE